MEIIKASGISLGAMPESIDTEVNTVDYMVSALVEWSGAQTLQQVNDPGTRKVVAAFTSIYTACALAMGGYMCDMCNDTWMVLFAQVRSPVDKHTREASIMCVLASSSKAE